MATPRQLLSYPRELFSIMTAAFSRPVSVPFESPHEARAARGRVYSFRQALANAEGYIEGHEALMLMAPLARMRIDGSTLTISYEEPFHAPDPTADDTPG